jgi:fructokinase
MAAPRISIAAFGEALWDVLPKGIFLGGAPVNVAYHLSRHGVRAVPISAVGDDFLGDEFIRRLEGWEIDVGGVTQLRRRATGTVRAMLDESGNASYRFARDVAWDHIPLVPARRRRPQPAALVYGTLALRSRSNRQVLDQLFQAWPDAVRVLDLNLRPPFDRAPAINFALKRAQWVKLNDHELAVLSGTAALGRGDLEHATRRFALRHHLSRVCVSAGPQGAGLLWHGTWFWEAGCPVRVADTIGAGDSFLAGFLAALLVRRDLPQPALAAACRVGEFVAAADGATPSYRCDGDGQPHPLSP